MVQMFYLYRIYQCLSLPNVSDLFELTSGGSHHAENRLDDARYILPSEVLSTAMH